jgi:plasmid stabilization system protein ParE
MRLELHPEAIADAREARLWYAERSPDAADAFMSELDRALASIAEAPMRWPVKAGARRYVMRRFPFVLVYRVSGSIVEVVAVAHGRRRPGYWKSR